MALYACICVPEFPSQTLLRLRPELRGKAVAVLAGERPFERVCSLTSKAASLGMRTGMIRAEAETFDAVLLRQSANEESAAKAALLHCVSAFSPRLEDQSDDICCLCIADLQGMERVLGPVQSAIRQIRSQLNTLGFFVKVASGTNVPAIVCLARSSPAVLLHIPKGEQAQALSRLPLSTLSLQPDHATTLAQWGLRTLGDLAELPEIELIARLGQEGQRLCDLACGKLSHLFCPIPVPFTLQEFREFESPVEQMESLLFALYAMLDQLILRAVSHALAIASLTIVLHLENRKSHARSIHPALPSVDRSILLKLIQLDLEVNAPDAAILSLQLSAEPGPVTKVQLGLFSPQRPEAMRLEVTLARIAAIVGQQRVGKASLKDTHQGDSFVMQPFTAVTRSSEVRRVLAPCPALRRLRPPVPIKVELTGRQLTHIWHAETHYSVEHVFGPWRSSGDWWSEQQWADERWDFSARSPQGSTFVGVLLRERHSNEWKLEAIYD